MATYTQASIIKRQYLDNSGNPLSAGKLYTYESGTLDEATTYQTSSGTEHANPIVLDSAGRISGSSEIYLEPGQSYKFILKTSADVEVWTQDGIEAVPQSGTNVDNPGTFGVSADAGDLMYLSDGSGSLTAGSWYKADADLIYASVMPQLGFAVNATASGATGSLRKDGTIELAGPLTPGADYYVSATAGSITSTAPTNIRIVGQAQSTTVLSMSLNPPVLPTVSTRIKAVNDFRLSLTTGVPATSADVTAATTVYLVPYGGNAISLYTGSVWVTTTSAQLSKAVPATTSTVYDIFADWNDGTPQLDFTAWTNDTTRATALTTQDGVYVKTGDTQQRYVGSFRTTGVSGQTEDSFAKRYLWNYYHRLPRPMRVVEATNTWAYTTAAFQQANASAANQLDVVVGVAEVPITAYVSAIAASDQAANAVAMAVSIGEDSATTAATGVIADSISNVAANVRSQLKASLTKFPAVGRHFYTWLEWSTATGTTTWRGDDGGASSPAQTGIWGFIDG